MRTSVWMAFGIVLFILSSCARSPYLKEQATLKQWIRHQPDIQNKLDSFAHYETQVIYIQINRDRDNTPRFRRFEWNEDDRHYFYPASTVKMAAAIIAVEKINQLAALHPGLHLFSPLKVDSIRNPQTPVSGDTTSWNQTANIGQYIKKIFIVSDNDAFNRLYEFEGQAYLNDRLKMLGYHHTHIIHRLDAPQFNFQSNKYTNPIHFYEEDRSLYHQPEQYNPRDVRVLNLKSTKKGTGYLSGDSLIHEPFDFGYKNFFSLGDMASMITHLFFPEYFPKKERFNLTSEQLDYIRKSMSTLPRESRFPFYDTTHQDAYCKFLMYGDSKDKIPDHIRIFNKVGWAYGYLTDAAYIVDFKNNVEFILAATINTNTDGIFNDGIYSYESLGLPYLSQLGKAFYQYELQRPRKYVPNLQPVQFKYSE